MNDLSPLLKQLTEADGVSGAENEVRRLLRDLIADHVDEWHIDPMGNLRALRRGTGDVNLRVMVDAHMDEVGLMVTGIDNDGTLRFLKIGGIDDRTLPGKVVTVGSKKLNGVIGAKPVHLLTRSERERTVTSDKMRIDIGASKKTNAAAKVNVGDRVAFVGQYEKLGATAVGKAFDDRAGCAVLVALLRGERFPFDLHAVFSVQEEVGLRGAQTAAYDIGPDVALVLECTPAYDLPQERDVSPNVALGKGPALYVMDSGTIQDPRFVSYLMRTAVAADIPYQIRRPGGGGTNAGAIQRIKGSLPTATIGLPGRHLHTPSSIINLDDLAAMQRLADAALRGLTENTLLRSQPS